MKRLIRVLAVLLGLLLVAMAVLWFIGGRTYGNLAQVTISAPRATVFTYLTDPAKLKHWVDGVVAIEPLTSERQTVGARSKIVVEEHGSRFEMNDEVIRYEPSEYLEVRITSPMFGASNMYWLTDEQGKTHVKNVMRTDYQGVARVFAPLMKGAVQQKLDADLQRLKKLVESQ
ncbi:MAG TPA: SRPBCC family protein [Pirellulales bacterium]|nr:SRPBCC family protein [Pirellulales bacterium]